MKCREGDFFDRISAPDYSEQLQMFALNSQNYQPDRAGWTGLRRNWRSAKARTSKTDSRGPPTKGASRLKASLFHHKVEDKSQAGRRQLVMEVVDLPTTRRRLHDALRET